MPDHKRKFSSDEHLALLQDTKSYQALDLLSQGIAIFDCDLKLSYANQAFIDLLDFPPEFKESGASLEDILRLITQCGEYGDSDEEALVRERIDLVRNSQPYSFERVTKNGTTLKVQGVPLDDDSGGFVTIYTDITAEKRFQDSSEKRADQVTAALAIDQDLFNEKTIIDLSFYNFRNAITAAYFANNKLEVLKVNDNFRSFFPILGNVTNVYFPDVLEQLGIVGEQIDAFVTGIKK